MKTDDIVEQALKEHEDRLNDYLARQLAHEHNLSFDSESGPIMITATVDHKIGEVVRYRLSVKKTSCSHTISHYVGFSEEYDYCTKCGEKL